MFDNLFTIENLLNVLGTFVYLFGELFLLFIAISFFVALLQVWVSKERIKRILSRPHKLTNAVLGSVRSRRFARAPPSPSWWGSSRAAHPSREPYRS